MREIVNIYLVQVVQILHCNYEIDATISNDSCIFTDGICETCENGIIIDNDLDNDGVCDSDEIFGCFNPAACNYNPNTTEEIFCIECQDWEECISGICICINDEDEDGICREECETIICEVGYECILGDCFCVDDTDLDSICDPFDNCPGYIILTKKTKMEMGLGMNVIQFPNK